MNGWMNNEEEQTNWSYIDLLLSYVSRHCIERIGAVMVATRVVLRCIGLSSDILNEYQGL